MRICDVDLRPDDVREVRLVVDNGDDAPGRPEEAVTLELCAGCVEAIRRNGVLAGLFPRVPKKRRTALTNGKPLDAETASA